MRATDRHGWQEKNSAVLNHVSPARARSLASSKLAAPAILSVRRVAKPNPMPFATNEIGVPN